MLKAWFNPRQAIVLVAIAMSLYHLTVAYVGQPIAQVHRPLHLLFAFVVLFGWRASGDRGGRPRLQGLWDLTLIGLTVAATGYLIVNAEYVTTRLAYVTPLTTAQYVLGTAMVVVILEAARRVVGWPLVAITLAFILYALVGNYLAGPFWHRGYSPGSVLEQLYLTLDGIWGVPLGVTASYVFLFILFGSILLKTGAGTFFTDLARAVSGQSAGGPAKAAVISSAFMGTLSGSSPANVVTTGSFTIPAMKQRGYPAHFAAGVEAAASTGGQLTPPIMGAAAFIMVEFTGIPYVEIMARALVPAILYFFGVFMMVSLEARRLDLKGEDPAEVPGLWGTLSARGYLLLPLVVMIVTLIRGYTPAVAAFWAILALVVLAVLLDAENRTNFFSVMGEAMTHAPQVVGPVTVACACGGIIVGIVLMTGLGQKISAAVLTLSGGYLLPTLILTTIVAVILGMGMPTSGAYIILAALLAPGIVELGVTLIGAHMFLLYGASKSSITPPVAIASYAAAGVANADPWRTSLTAFRLAIGVFLIPYMFVYGPPLLLIGDPILVAGACLTALAGIALLSVGMIGWLWTPLRVHERGLAIVAALVLVVPGWMSDAVGAALALLLVMLQRRRAARESIA